MLKTGVLEKPLGGTKTDRPRKWRSLDTLTAYLRKDLRVVHIDGIDTSHHSDLDPDRPGAAARLKRAHEAAAYDTWYRAQVDAGIKEADDPATQWISHEESMARMHQHLDELEARARGKD